MNTEEHTDPVWNLLAKSPQPVVRSNFTADVLKAIQDVAQDPVEIAPGKIVAFSTPARKRWPVISAVAGIAAMLAIGLTLHFAPPTATNTVANSDQPSASTVLTSSDVQSVKTTQDDTLEQEFTAVQDIHALIAVEDPADLNDAQLLALIN